jgi:hypothetical protein
MTSLRSTSFATVFFILCLVSPLDGAGSNLDQRSRAVARSLCACCQRCKSGKQLLLSGRDIDRTLPTRLLRQEASCLSIKTN